MTNDPPKKPTSFDVAQLAGVHRSVVSRALSGTGRMSDETRKRILTAADELGYRINLLARGLQNQSSGLVGVVASRIDTPFRARQVRVIAQELLHHDFCPVLIAAESGDRLSGLMSRLLSYNVAGLIVTSDTPPREIIDECAKLQVPVSLINRDIAVTDADHVQIDINAAGGLAFEMLHSRGGRRFAVLEPQDQTYTVAGRAQVFADCCRRNGAAVKVIRPDGQGYENGVDVAAEVRDADVDAVFATTDLLALGLLDGVRARLGVAVPDDLQIVGFDDIPQASWLSYDVSTVHQEIDKAAKGAVELIMKRIEQPARDFECLHIGLQPIYRSTTRPVIGA